MKPGNKNSYKSLTSININEKEYLKKIFSKKVRDESDLKNILNLIKHFGIVKECYKKANHYINISSNSLSIFKDCN